MKHEARQRARGGFTHRWVVANMCLVLLSLLLAFGGLIRQNDIETRRALSDRFETRAELTASFARDFVEDLAERERTQAERLLSGPEVDQVAFESVVRGFDFEAAVLLDDAGRLLHVWPARPDLIGRDMTVDYAHLRTAVGGQIGVSEMVPSAARGIPVTAVAVPFDTGVGRRVFSGAFSPSTTPLGAYLDSVVPVSGGTAYLTDRSGAVLAGGSGAARDSGELKDLSIGVSEVRSSSGRVTAAVAAVPGSPWRVVLVAPSDGLYAPVDAERLSPWVLLMALAASGCFAVVLFVRLGRARAEAALTARTDSLTGLPNRRAMQEVLTGAASLAARHHVPLGALMVDIDRFKNINDTHGHDAGDVVLRAVAVALAGATRESDTAGRWGGEEFLVLLPHTGHLAALTVAERIREAIATTVRSQHSGGYPVTVSIGVAVLDHGDASSLIREADGALFEAKASGRNRVEISSLPLDACDPVTLTTLR